MELQKQRFDASLAFEYRIDPASRRIVVPKMILQPIVENFFKHGFRHTEATPAKLTISSLIVGNELVIRVEDNGRGVNEEQLKAINDQLKDEDAGLRGQDSGIGLSNVLARLKLHYRGPVAIALDNARPTGLSVSLHIPLEEEPV